MATKKTATQEKVYKTRVHHLAAKGHLQADRHSLAHLKVRNRLFRLAEHGLLSGDYLQFVLRNLNGLCIVLNVAQTGAYNNLYKLRHGQGREGCCEGRTQKARKKAREKDG